MYAEKVVGERPLETEERGAYNVPALMNSVVDSAATISTACGR